MAEDDPTVDTGPRLQWIDDSGAWHAADDYPLDPAGALGASGTGALTLAPSPCATHGPISLGAPALSVVEIPYSAPAGPVEIVGEPTLTLSYRGSALPAATFLYAQVVDGATQRVVGGAGDTDPGHPRRPAAHRHPQAREIAIHAHPASQLRLQLVPSTNLYGMQRSIGTVNLSAISSTLPLVSDP